jgi:hypothetical protein
MSEKKVVRRSVAIALGIICIILAVSLAGALAYYESMTNTKSSEEQINPNTWTEGTFSFTLDATNSTKYTIPTGGFRSLTITIIAAHHSNPILNAFQVFIGSFINDTIIDYQTYDALSFIVFPPPAILPGSAPWTSWARKLGFESLEQTLEIHSSEIVVWIWDNSTVDIWGDIYYYLGA